MAKDFPLSLKPVPCESLPDAESEEFAELLDRYIEAGEQLIDTLPEWKKGSQYNKGSTQTYTISAAVQKSLGIKDHWAARESFHAASVKPPAKPAAAAKMNGGPPAPIQEPIAPEAHHPVPPAEEFAEVKTAPGPPVGEFHAEPGPISSASAHGQAAATAAPAAAHPIPHSRFPGPGDLVRSVSRRFSRKASQPLPVPEPTPAPNADDQSEIDKQKEVMTTPPEGIYERFRRGLLEYHSENEREYIESMRETKCLQVYKSHVAEVWKATFVVPRPASPRTFVFLLICREIKTEPVGERVFMNVSVPVTHPDLPEKTGEEAGRCRGCYVSVERVRETEGGKKVEWRMATASHAGGNVPMFVSNNQMPAKISEDVPSFLKWLDKKFPQ